MNQSSSILRILFLALVLTNDEIWTQDNFWTRTISMEQRLVTFLLSSVGSAKNIFNLSFSKHRLSNSYFPLHSWPLKVEKLLATHWIFKSLGTELSGSPVSSSVRNKKPLGNQLVAVALQMQLLVFLLGRDVVCFHYIW